MLGSLDAMVSHTAELDCGDMLALDCVWLREVEVGVAAVTEDLRALVHVDDDEAMLTHVFSPTDVTLPIVVVVVEVLVLRSCDAVLTDKVVDTANVALVDDIADVVKAVEDVTVDVLAVVLGPQGALAT